jgi:hypothetical protein
MVFANGAATKLANRPRFFFALDTFHSEYLLGWSSCITKKVSHAAKTVNREGGTNRANGGSGDWLGCGKMVIINKWLTSM